NLIVKETLLNDCYVINLKRYEDNRGYFMETFDERIFSKSINQKVSFVQDNLSLSYKNVLRGIHCDFKSWKLVTCVFGKIYLVIVNVNKNSPKYLKTKSFKILLSA
ncbi:MAG TPA: dTDP-4-dehydrorhamnose 3,5-epimerase, partial [Acholeplasmataceae bacterium]|nr:dTDP-4-dehydrorhamnose 3,5-epimerase [Acholeplasmataceae bacterium]